MNRIRTALLIGTVIAVGIASAGTWALKPGLWQLTIDHETSGMPSIPEEDLAKMPPDMRARAEAAYKAHQNAGPQHDIYDECITQKDLDRTIFDDDKNDPSCKKTVLSDTATRKEISIRCTNVDQSSSGTMKFEAPSPERMTGSMHMTVTRAGNTMVMNSRIDGHWQAADCGNIKGMKRRH